MPSVLYIDDEPANLIVFEAACGDEFEVLTATSGKEGLELLATHDVGVLLTDQRMPGMTGVEVLEAARAMKPDTVRVLITAYSDINEAVAAINRSHVERYMRKPWQPEELRMAVRDGLGTYDTRMKLQALERRMSETERVYALGVVASGIAHELRNPLGVMSPSLELARQTLLKLDETLRVGGHEQLRLPIVRVLDHIDLAAQSATQMLEITRGMELSQRRRDDEQAADLVEVVRLTLRMLRSEAMRRATVKFEPDAQVPFVRGSRTQLGQVVLNLVVNALEAMPRDPTRRGNVLLRVRTETDAVVLTVEDDGPGIAPENLPRIFDPFFSTKSSGGTGLGLAISKKIVEEAGGRIAVESTPGKGTRFTVRFALPSVI
jgi:two-component system, NtrC family, sensor kinase